MLACRALRLGRSPQSLGSLRYGVNITVKAPSNKRYFIQSLNNEFFDLSLALPYPPDWPAYTATIILATVFARFAILPATLWAHRRQVRYEQHVMPLLAELKPKVMHEQALAMKQEGLLDDKTNRHKIHSKRCKAILSTREKELCKEFKCGRSATTYVPPLSQLPVFVVMTTMFARMAVDPTSPLDSESFLTLTSLAHPDPTMSLPVALGLITMANVESSTWILNAAEKEELRDSEERKAKMAKEKGAFRIAPDKAIKSTMRVFSVIRIYLAAIAPGSVVVYWITSSTFGLFQTWVMNWLDARRRRQLRALRPLVQPAVQPSGLSVTPTRFAKQSGSASTLASHAVSQKKSSSGPGSSHSKHGSKKGKN